MRPDRRSTLLCLSVLCLLPAILQWPNWLGWLSQNPIYSFFSGLTNGGPNSFLSGAPWVDGNAGNTTQALGRGVVRAWWHGRIPWWNHNTGVGMPLAAAMQPGAFFLPFILLLGLFNGLVLLKIVMQAIAGMACYGLLRTLGLGRWASCLGGVLFQLSGTFTFFSDAPIMPAPFLPMLLLAIETCVQRAKRGLAGGWGLFATALGFSLIGCFPEMAYLDGLLALGWSLLRFAQLGEARRSFAVKLAGGGLLALMITLPATLPFVQYLSLTGGIAKRVAADLGLEAPHYAMLLMPALYGPPFWGQRYTLWATFVGGYMDVALVLLMLLGVVQSGLRKGGLRIMLTVWIVVAMLKVAGAPFVAPLLNHLPLMRMVQFFRYGQLGIDMAAIILAAFALDAWQMGQKPTRGQILLIAAIGFGLSVAALVAARPTISSLFQVPHYSWFLFGSVGWAILISLVILSTVARQTNQKRRIILTTILVLNASVLFSIPLLAGARNRDLDLGGIAFLRSHLGLQRVYTMGPMAPNYGTFFGIATIDYDSVLVPSLWVDYIHRHLDPDTTPAIFDGVFPKPASGNDTRDEVFRQNEAAFAAIGVRYVVQPAGQVLRLLPFGPWKTITAHPLTDGQSIVVRIPGAIVQAGSADMVELVLGLYAQSADGTLALRICQQGRCRLGSAHLRQAVDNGAVKMVLAGSLTLRSGMDVTLEVRRDGGISPVAIWYNDRGPLLSLDYLSLGNDPPPVYHGSVMRIDEVPGAAAYASAPGCLLTLGDRDHMVAQCTASSILTRLELDYPGWQAKLDGLPVAITHSHEIFQSVTLPAGRSAITFIYSPTGEGPAWWICGSGLLMAIGSTLRAYRRSLRPCMVRHPGA